MFQRTTLIGNLGQDPEIRHTQNQTAVATLSVATSSSRKDADGNYQKETEWHRVIAWKNTAENVSKYLHKGSKVHVEGHIKTRNYEDKHGVKKYVTEIHASRIDFLDPKEQDDRVDRSAHSSQKSGRQDPGKSEEPGLDDIPF